MFHDIAGHEDLTEAIIACGIRVHEALGPGLLESVYRQCLDIELGEAGLTVEKTRKVKLGYRGHTLDTFFCPDLIVNGLVIVELKAIERVAAVHVAQPITYLKLTGLPVGLLMNFNVPLLKRGTRRVVRPDLYVKR
jgi:GxxExxY protein